MIHKNIIGYELSAEGKQIIQAINPTNSDILEETFNAATLQEVDKAAKKAEKAWKTYRLFSGKQKAAFLRAIACQIENLGATLVQRVMQESGLPEGRVIGERGRTCNQLRLFADLVEEGHWVNAVIDTAMPDRQPIPRPDIRNMMQAVGPIAVFTASNFPLAFSTAGGDTAAALAAGCPVIVKAHESHPGTNALVAEAIQKAAKETRMPDGVFSSLYAKGYEVGTALVQHPSIKGVAFTGSLGGGMALYRAAAQREEPIPVFAEMGSINPIFLLPNTLQNNEAALATKVANSVNLGAGQFCTNPGLVVVLENEQTNTFVEELKRAFAELEPATMLNASIHQHFEKGKQKCLDFSEVKKEFAYTNGTSKDIKAYPAIASIAAANFLKKEALQEEVFGPFTLLVQCKNETEMLTVAQQLSGQLTATLIGANKELSQWKRLQEILQEKVGRLIFNGVPTGVEVCHAMQHGGPFPASTDGRFTSVGTGAIARFARPIAFQDCPDPLLPDALKTDNPLNIWRLVNGKYSRT